MASAIVQSLCASKATEEIGCQLCLRCRRLWLRGRICGSEDVGSEALVKEVRNPTLHDLIPLAKANVSEPSGSCVRGRFLDDALQLRQ